MNTTFTCWLLSAFLIIPITNFAQTDTASLPVAPNSVPKEDKPLKFNLNEDGSHFFQVNFLNQTWVRYNRSNPGTTLLQEPQNATFDIGLRRTRIQMYGQITDRSFIYFQFGQNNFNRVWGGQGTGNRFVAAFFHDALCEYKVSRQNQLKIGGGLTITSGLSRFSNPSVGTILALDVPVFAQATVNATDLFSRKLSIYARGQVGKLDYRIALSDPFPITTSGSGATFSNYATFSPRRHKLQSQAYLTYQFFDHENHLTPYFTGTHLGSKKIFNIGGGIIFQQDAMWRRAPGGAISDSIIFEPMILWALETFLDKPLNKDKGTALTAYLGYFNTNYGQNYIRTQAQMNPADGLLPTVPQNVSGSGNGWPMFGTGQVIYAQAGYLMKKNLLKSYGTLQPYVTYQRNMFSRLENPANVYNIGINWLLKGHKSKFSLDYQNRPVYSGANEVISRRGSVIFQYQIFI